MSIDQIENIRHQGIVHTLSVWMLVQLAMCALFALKIIEFQDVIVASMTASAIACYRGNKVNSFCFSLMMNVKEYLA